MGVSSSVAVGTLAHCAVELGTLWSEPSENVVGKSRVMVNRAENPKIMRTWTTVTGVETSVMSTTSSPGWMPFAES